MKNRLLLLSLFIAGACAQVALGATDYAIRMERTSKVGDKYRIEATGTDYKSALIRVEDKDLPPQGEHFSFELSAACETLAINPRGGQQKARLVIEKLIGTAGTQKTELLPAGTVVTVERVGDTNTFRVGETAATPVIAKALATVGVSMTRNTGADDDDIFGTKERKKVGSAWPISSDIAAADLSKSGIPAKGENVTGTTTLVEVIGSGNDAVLRLAATMTIHGVNPPLPPGIAVKSSEFTATHGGLYPVDLSKPVQMEVSAMDMVVTAAGVKDGKPMTLTLTMKTSHETKYISN